MTNILIAKTFIVLRAQLSDGDHPHDMRKHITVEQAERYNEAVEKLRSNNRK